MLLEVPSVILIFVETLKLTSPIHQPSQEAFSMIAEFENYYELLAVIQRS